MELMLTIGESQYALTAEQDSSGGWNIEGLGGKPVRLESLTRLPGDLVRFQIAGGSEASGRVVEMPFAKTEAGALFSRGGRVFTVTQSDSPAARKSARGRSSGSLVAPMQGVVAEVLVAEGDQVEAHAPILIIEAMKVIATIEAPVAGTVTKLHYSKGDLVPHGAVVADVTPLSGEAGAP